MIWIIYFWAWAKDEGMQTPKGAYSPYMEFSSSGIQLDKAIEIAQAIGQLEPRHKFAIAAKNKDGWYWKEDEGKIDQEIDNRPTAYDVGISEGESGINRR